MVVAMNPDDTLSSLATERKALVMISLTLLRKPSHPVFILAASLLAGCENFTPAPVEFTNDDTVSIGEVRTLEIRETVLSSLPETPPPQDADKAELGRLLFWDPILSGDKDVACATCHLPEAGYADGRVRSVGVGGQGRGAERTPGQLEPVKRNAQSVLNVVWNGIDELGSFDPQTAPMFWDNRAEGLLAQAIDPLKSKEEMRGENFTEDEIITELLNRLNGIPEYSELFSQHYGVSQIGEGELADALSVFQSILVANNAPYDRWMRGDDDAMTARQVSGMQEFVIAGCAECHSGPLFSDFELHVLGVPEADGLVEPDDGNGEFAFRTPSLRQLQFTAPYFHGGQKPTLSNAINFYDEPERSSNPSVAKSELDPDFLALPEMDDGLGSVIEAFLETLNDPVFDQVVPESVPSGLAPGGSL